MKEPTVIERQDLERNETFVHLCFKNREHMENWIGSKISAAYDEGKRTGERDAALTLARAINTFFGKTII